MEREWRGSGEGVEREWRGRVIPVSDILPANILSFINFNKVLVLQFSLFPESNFYIPCVTYRYIRDEDIERGDGVVIGTYHSSMSSSWLWRCSIHQALGHFHSHRHSHQAVCCT